MSEKNKNKNKRMVENAVLLILFFTLKISYFFLFVTINTAPIITAISSATTIAAHTPFMSKIAGDINILFLLKIHHLKVLNRQKIH